MSEAGDGTTTATLLAREIYREGLMALAAGEHPMVLKNSMTDASQQVIELLSKMSVRHLDFEMLKSIATISANGD